ncbi:hypothetical protein DFH11DRAFT_1544884 [Phellopilus nigrolimitatus]|nr:hypothetical protein DFH11DRAFT_1544884 [Phellopilus nigrolimitatus]
MRDRAGFFSFRAVASTTVGKKLSKELAASLLFVDWREIHHTRSEAIGGGRHVDRTKATCLLRARVRALRSSKMHAGVNALASIPPSPMLVFQSTTEPTCPAVTYTISRWSSVRSTVDVEGRMPRAVCARLVTSCRGGYQLVVDGNVSNVA